jgi:hypothetical protein
MKGIEKFIVRGNLKRCVDLWKKKGPPKRAFSHHETNDLRPGIDFVERHHAATISVF